MPRGIYQIAIAAFLVGMTALASAQGRVPVILDTDIGDDIDDTWALAMLLGRPELELKLVVTASDDTPTKARLLAKALETMGHGGVPIGIGKKTSDRELNQTTWIGDYDLAAYPGKVHEDGVGQLIAEVKAASAPITIIVLGPQTNIAEALARDASIARNARIVCMAGSVRIGYNGKPTPDPEWNVFRDVAAAKAVFAAPWEIVMAPLDICGTLTLKGDAYQRVAESKSPRASTVIQNYDAWSNRSKHGANESSVLYDTVAVYLAYDRSFCEMATVNLSIDSKGNTAIDETGGRPVQCAMKWKDLVGFERALIESLTRE